MKRFFILLFVTAYVAQPGLGFSQEPSLKILQAVRFAMEYTPEVSLAKEEVNLKSGVVDVDKGDRDPSVSLDIVYDRDDIPLTPYEQSVYQKEAEKTNTLTSTLSAEKTLESGITLGPSISLERKEDDLLNYETDNKSEVMFEISIPIFDLFDYLKQGSQPLPSEIEKKAVYWDLAHTVSTSALDAASAFWQTLQAQKMLELLRESEKEAQLFHENLGLMIEKDEYPPADLLQAKVDWDEQVIARMEAEQKLFSALQNLAVVMGMPEDRFLDLPRLQGKFPGSHKGLPPSDSMIRHALDNRMDLTAQKVRSAYYQRLMADAKLDLMPDLNLDLNAGYHGLIQTNEWGGYLDSLHSNVPGPSFGVEVSVTQPLGNLASNGELSQRKALYRQAKINETALMRQIYSNVLTSGSKLQKTMDILNFQQDVVNRYRQSMEETNLKFKYQNVTLKDLLDMRSSYRDSRINLIKRQKGYAIAILEFRQTSGSLLVSRDKKFTITQAQLLTPWSSKKN